MWAVGTRLGRGAIHSVALAFLGACTFGIDTSALTVCADGRCADGGPADGALPDGSPPDGESEAGDGASGLDGGVCPSGRGSAMVRLASDRGVFCIDATEATNDDFASFLASPDRPPESRLALACRGRGNLWTPEGWPPAPGLGQSPVAFVDFCEAQAFCVWAGKSLCGALGGGPLATTAMSQLDKDAWFFACGAGARDYPYGTAYDGSICNGVDFGATHSVPVGSLQRCKGGVSGPYDQSGNLWEWIDACEGDVDGDDRCYVRGGAFNAPAVELTCASQRGGKRTVGDATVGIRCCAP